MKHYTPSDYVLHDALALSSGTIATLINDNRYQIIEGVQSNFVIFIASRGPRLFSNWQDAWRAFRKEKHHD